MPSEPGVHMGGHARPAGECSAPFLHATEPDSQLKPSGTRSEQDDVLGRKEMSAKACVSRIDRMLRPPRPLEVALIR
jgi:hypothetical protein